MGATPDSWNDYKVIEHLTVIERSGGDLYLDGHQDDPKKFCDAYTVEIVTWRDDTSRSPTYFVRAHSPRGARLQPREVGKALGLARRDAGRLAGVLSGHRRDGRWVVELEDVDAITSIMGLSREFVDLDTCWKHASKGAAPDPAVAPGSASARRSGVGRG